MFLTRNFWLLELLGAEIAPLHRRHVDRWSPATRVSRLRLGWFGFRWRQRGAAQREAATPVFARETKGQGQGPSEARRRAKGHQLGS